MLTREQDQKPPPRQPDPPDRRRERDAMPTCFTRRACSCRDPFIFLEQNGKRTIVLSDLEIDRGAQAGAGG